MIIWIYKQKKPWVQNNDILKWLSSKRIYEKFKIENGDLSAKVNKTTRQHIPDFLNISDQILWAVIILVFIKYETEFYQTLERHQELSYEVIKQKGKKKDDLLT